MGRPPIPQSQNSPQSALDIPRNACTTITTKRHRRRRIGTGAQKYRRVKGKRSFYEGYRQPNNETPVCGRDDTGSRQGQVSNPPSAQTVRRRCPPEVEDRLGRNADRQPGHCGDCGASARMRTHDAGSDKQARRTPSRRRGDPCGRPHAGDARSRSERIP